MPLNISSISKAWIGLHKPQLNIKCKLISCTKKCTFQVNLSVKCLCNPVQNYNIFNYYKPIQIKIRCFLDLF